MSKLTRSILITRQFFGFLKSDNARTAPSETTVQEVIRAVKQIRDFMERDSAEKAGRAIDAAQYASIAGLLAIFGPLSFCASV